MTAAVCLLTCLIIVLILLYKKNQQVYMQRIESLKATHEKTILSAQLEMQEQTLLHIGREIHDNINLSLTLAKLHLNTFAWKDEVKATFQVSTSIDLISKAIEDLSSLSKSMNSDIINSQGLITAIEKEVQRIRDTGLFDISFTLSGEPVYLTAQGELLLFRIIQEAFSNIIKHANASFSSLSMHFDENYLYVSIVDNGRGFNQSLRDAQYVARAGLKNMEARVKMIGGSMRIVTNAGNGTVLFFTIPLDYAK